MPIVGVFVAFLFGWPSMAQQNLGQSKAAANNPAQDQRPAPPATPSIIPSITAPCSQAEPCYAQENAPEKAFPWPIRPEWVIVYITAIYVFIAWRTLRAIKRQANIMEGQARDAKESGKHTETLAIQAEKQSALTQRQLDLANRPWLCMDSITAATAMEFKQDGSCSIFFNCQIRNVGHSVAQHVMLTIEPILSGTDNMLEVKERISTQLKRPVENAFEHGKLIFPTQGLIDRVLVHIPPKRLSEAIEKSPFMDGGKQIKGLGIELFVCLDYQSTLDPARHHQTQNIYLLGHSPGNAPISGLFMPSAKIYPQQHMVLTFKGFGAYAD